MDVWLERQNSSGDWNVAGYWPYWNVSTPNPGPSGSLDPFWTGIELSPNENYRVFSYTYMYNQGGSNQGKYIIYSTSYVYNSGGANQAPIAWFPQDVPGANSSSVVIGGSLNLQVVAQDDNANLAGIILSRDGVPIASVLTAPDTAALRTIDVPDHVGPLTYTAVAYDTYGAVSQTATLTVTVLDKLDQAGVASTDVTLPVGVGFTPAYLGGSGIGAWQFAVSSYTNWDLGTSGNGGTNVGSWVSSWVPPGPGAYSFWVARNGDGNYKSSGATAPYNLHVAGFPTATITTDRTNISLGESANINATFSPGAYDALIGTNIDQPAGTPAGSGQDASPQSSRSFTFTPSAIGDYTFAARVVTPLYTWSTYASATVHVSAVQNVAITPASAALREGEPVTLTASGGNNGYVWGGSAAGSGNTHTVSFNAPGDYTVTVYSPAGGIFPQSNTAVATLHIIDPPSVAISALPDHGSAPLSTTIYWSATQYSSAAVSGPGLSANYGNGSQPVVLGAGTYVYTITADGAGGHVTANATVTVVANGGFIAATPAAVDFGSLYRDSLAGSPNTGSQTVTFQNIGNGPVVLNSIAISGSEKFTVGPASLPTTLAPNATFRATLTAGPGMQIGSVQGTLTAAASSNTVTVPLTATGLAPVLNIIWK